jgi:3-oxoacyl-[acyl-carrier-protein] synthase II
MSGQIAITGFGSCTALGCGPVEVLERLVAGDSGIRQERLSADFSTLFGCVEGTPALAERARDFTADFARDASDAALSQCGIAGAYAPDRVATVIGCSKGRLSELAGKWPGRLDPTVFPGDTVGAEVAARYQLTGPVLNYPAACATGLACMIAGVNLLRHGVADAVLAGSAEASGLELVLASFANMGALAPGLMRPFHAERCGFNAGEGAAVFVLEREDAAMRRGAKVLARIVGWDLRSDAHHLTSPEESGAVIVECIRRTLRMADWLPGSVDYINAHGTGTRQNDAIEARAIREVFGGETPLVSSLKPYIGHLLGGSAAAELALCVLALRNKFVPWTVGLDEPDPQIAPIRHVPAGGVHRQVTRFLKVSLGFGGHLACLAVQLLPEAN